MQRPRRARWLDLGPKLAACALAGAVLTVWVAWVALRLWPAWVPSIQTNNPARWHAAVPPGWPDRPEITWTSSTWIVRKSVSFMPAPRQGLSVDAWYSLSSIEAGFPFKALGAHHLIWRGGQAHEGGIRAPGWVTDNPWIAQNWPVRPTWPGFALDTLFYGTLVFLLWSAPGLIRSGDRKRSGHCPACGYDLRGIQGVCPECGVQRAGLEEREAGSIHSPS